MTAYPVTPSGRKPCNALCLVQSGLLLLVMLGCSACSYGKLVHSDGEPFLEQGSRIPLENGWIALDSCSTGTHALVELNLEAISAIPITPKWLNTHALGTLRDFQIDGPWCRTEYSDLDIYDPDVPPSYWKTVQEGEERCIYRVRAEFTLREPALPHSDYLAHVRTIVPGVRD